MLVKLYELPDRSESDERMRSQGVVVRRGIVPEASLVERWVEANFSRSWADECISAFANHPPTIYLAMEGKTLVGFGCFEATCKAFFGPTGVATSHRGRGIGKNLLLACLYGLRELGYGYGIIGGAGPTEFYRQSAGAIIIEGSSPGIYEGMLRA